MSLNVFNFTTGPATLEDVGTLKYNGCVFSPLFATEVSGTAVKDAAIRTVKFMEYAIVADGYVTLPTGATSTSGVMDTLRQLLTAQGGTLIYTGRGMDIEVNLAGGRQDAAWGPTPELLEFQPLGAGRSAKVRWQVKTRIPEQIRRAQTTRTLTTTGLKGGGAFALGGLAALPMLQFNYDTSVEYGEDGYSSLSVNGTLEIPLTRTPSQSTRTLDETADDLRGVIESRIISSIDLARFRITSRRFNLSRDKRTLEWSFTAEEKPYMDLPPGCTVAHGSYSVKPARAGMGLCNWLCTLRATYMVKGPHRQADANAGPRRLAWVNFLALLRYRMAYSLLAPDFGGGRQNPGKTAEDIALAKINGNASAINTMRTMERLVTNQNTLPLQSRKAWLLDFGFDEGLYLDSKTTSFSATWRLVCPFNHILMASGLWRRLDEDDAINRNLWATSVQNISGAQSWLPNKADPKIDIIVDMGGG